MQYKGAGNAKNGASSCFLEAPFCYFGVRICGLRGSDDCFFLRPFHGCREFSLSNSAVHHHVCTLHFRRFHFGYSCAFIFETLSFWLRALGLLAIGGRSFGYRRKVGKRLQSPCNNGISSHEAVSKSLQIRHFVPRNGRKKHRLNPFNLQILTPKQQNGASKKHEEAPFLAFPAPLDCTLSASYEQKKHEKHHFFCFK